MRSRAVWVGVSWGYVAAGSNDRAPLVRVTSRGQHPAAAPWRVR